MTELQRELSERDLLRISNNLPPKIPDTYANIKWVGSIFKMYQHLRNYPRYFQNVIQRFGTHVGTHPYVFAAQLSGCLGMWVSTCLLPMLGFIETGPLAGSIAASWQSSIGSVVAGSPFAFLQSAGMGGAAAGLFTAVGITGAVAVVILTAMYTKEIRQGIEGTAKGVSEWVKGTATKAGDGVKGTGKQVAEGISNAWLRLGEWAGSKKSKEE